ncbi:PREDICTED: 3-ketoacyl-CoA thiolase, mitochondrial-like [Rhagoletis zephyria]|uniref:3-ketoacyl-CoA thiolase, mitochondrial-like n=1 Tax=Rhagoletis zephyria TaxID=28612 RepID=UPI000811321C|nr:PREDICTED: 3-ketoacyl-CoA thiolase, mitochondrial-like [Rhagoletis zephyria]
MAALRRGVFIVGAKRTPFGTVGGKLKDINSIELGQTAAKAAIEAAKISPEQIDSVVVGNVMQHTHKNGTFIARHVGLGAGIRLETPCLSVNRLCGSGFEAVVNASHDIVNESAEIALAVGTESMSNAPFIIRGARFGVKFGQAPVLEDSMFTRADPADGRYETRMGITAENLATKYGISREECDTFALLSQTRWAEAQKGGKFKEEMIPLTIKVKGKEVVVDVDEHPRPDTSLEKLSKLAPAFKKDGVVTAGNASGINDGAGALVLASEDAVKAKGLGALSRVVAYAVVGCDPTIMGIGPVPAIRKLLAKTGLTLDQVDAVEVNEAFAPQWLAVQKELGLDLAKSNLNGGAIALGHPLGASGARILTNLTYELKRRNGKYAIGSACIGGGQGIAVLLENVQ